MALFCITRTQFLDRVFTLADLGILVDMLRRWYLIRSADAPQTGRVHCEARVYAFARPSRDAIARALSTRLPRVSIDSPDPDELRLAASPRSADDQPDLSVWRVVLSEPLVANLCVMLRLTFEGPVKGLNGRPGDGRTTFILCGALAGDGAIMVKAIWRLGFDESFHSIYRVTPWTEERLLLAAFDLYRRKSAEAGTLGRDTTIAAATLQMMGQKANHLFGARRDERRIMWLTRHWAELPDDRGPAGFLRRFGLPLVGGAALVAVPIVFRPPLPTTALCVLVGAYLLWSATRIAWQKGVRVLRYYTAMRAGLGKLYSGPVTYQHVNLSQDKTPTLLKCSAELAALGARHVCDVSINTARGTFDGNRVYTLGATTASVGLLRQFNKLQFFPARPILLISTRFEDGRRHYTVNRAMYRKSSRRTISGRCLMNDGAVDEVFALHDQQIAKLTAAGAVPLPAPATPADVLRQLEQDHDESREAWKTSPYSWGDALHEAFKVCRPEYLRK